MTFWENLAGLLTTMVMVAFPGMLAVAAGAKWERRWLIWMGGVWMVFAIVAVLYGYPWSYSVEVQSGLGSPPSVSQPAGK